ncbi:MAG: hypothetical protein ACOYVD_00950 [Bacillota bacterium]
MLYLDWVLVLGIITFIAWFFICVYRGTYEGMDDAAKCEHLIVIVKNKEAIIEGIIRRVLVFQRQLGDNVKLYIVDLNSRDKTVEIINRLAYPYNYFSVILLNDRQELGRFIERYIDKNCLVMDYSSKSESLFRNIKDCKYMTKV